MISPPVLRIQIAGRLVGQQQFRLVDERAGDGDALLFAAGKLGRLVIQPVLEADAREQFAPRASRVALEIRAMRAGRQTFSSAVSSGSR